MRCTDLCTKCHSSGNCSNVDKFTEDSSDLENDVSDVIEQPRSCSNPQNQPRSVKDIFEEIENQNNSQNETFEADEEMHFDEESDNEEHVSLAKRPKLV